MLVLVVAVSEAAAELVADALWASGVRGVEERDASGGRGEHTVELRAFVAGDRGLIHGVAAALPGSPTWWIEDLDTTPSTAWRDHAVPVEVVPWVVVSPAWLDVEPGDGAVVVSIDPGAAFGLDHPTTTRTLAHVAERLATRPGGTVADVGCGSGVIAVAAALLGAPVVRAIDVSAAAVEATTANAARNGVSATVEADTTPAAELDGTYDIVVANILAPTLIALADDLRRLTAPDGVLVIGGVLVERHGHVLEALAPMEPVTLSREAGWAALVLRHPAAR